MTYSAVQPFYIIQLACRLDSHGLRRFDGMTITHTEDGAGTTILSGYVRDQSGLHGLLEKIHDLNLPLMSVTSILL